MGKFIIIILSTFIFISCEKRECSNCRWVITDKIDNYLIEASYKDMINKYSRYFSRDNVCKDAVAGKRFEINGEVAVIRSKNCN
jgi:hypothetical protein